MLKRATALLAILTLSSTARAQSASAQAEDLFNQGRTLLEAGKIAEACAAFEASERASAATTTLFSVGVCREKAGQLATAWGAFVEVQRVTRGSADATDQKLAQLAEANAGRLAPRLSRLTIQVASARALPGLEVRRDDAVVDAGAWNRSLPVDGGTIHIVAHAPGHDDWSTTITVKPEGDVQTVEVPALVVSAAPPPSPPPARVAPPARILPAALGAGALVLGGAALSFELWGESYNNQIAGSTNNAVRLDLWHSANWRRYTAEGLGVAAIGAASVAVYLYLRGGHEGARPGVTLAPWTTPQVAGLALDGAF